MAPAIAFTLPAMQLVCNLVMPGAPEANYTVPGATPNQLESLTTNQSTILPDGYVAHRDIGTSYKVYTDLVTWKEARERCLAENTNLAVIDTILKVAHVINQKPVGKPVHVGIHSMYDRSEWVSATNGTTLSKLPWIPNQPASDHTYDITLVHETQNGLVSQHYTFTAGFVCEIPIVAEVSVQ